MQIAVISQDEDRARRMQEANLQKIAAVLVKQMIHSTFPSFQTSLRADLMATVSLIPIMRA